MKTMQQIFSGDMTDALGWTLLHSIWQGYTITLLMFLALRIYSGASSQFRYNIACSALLLITFSCLSTFLFLYVKDGAQLSSLVDSGTPIYSA